jgi:hypothetical protein
MPSRRIELLLLLAPYHSTLTQPVHLFHIWVIQDDTSSLAPLDTSPHAAAVL